MKRTYTQMYTVLQHVAKKSGVSTKNYLKAVVDYTQGLLDDIQRGMPIDAYRGRNASIVNVLLSVDKYIVSGDVKHIFLTDLDFCNWLVECVKCMELDHAQVIWDYTGHKVGVLHFPNGHGKRSVGFAVIPARTYNGDLHDNTLTLSYSLCNNDLACCSAIIPLGDPVEALKGPPEAAWYAKLIIGIGMYLGVFPETVLKGPPEDLKHPAHHQYKDITTIAISPKIQHREGTSPMMHFRKGHFRFLRSDKFKHKKLTWVFVHDCVVNKGNTITVQSPEEMTSKEEYASGRIDSNQGSGGDSVRQTMHTEGRLEPGDKGTAEVSASQRVHDPEEGAGTEG